MAALAQAAPNAALSSPSTPRRGMTGAPLPQASPHAWTTPRAVTRRGPPLRVTASAEAAPKPALAPVPRVQLGKSGVESPALGIGAWAWGDRYFWNDGTWDASREAGARAAYQTAVSLGLDLVDTAEVYGTRQFGAEDSETLLGRFLGDSQQGQDSGVSPALVATKFGALPWRFTRESVVDALKGSLDRLGLKSVDLYQIHWPGVWGNEAFIDGLGDCVDQGLARAVGVSNFTESRLRKAHAQLAKRGVALASNQVHYNILYRVPEENGVKAACEELGVTLIAYSPLAQGMLSGKYSVDNPPTGPRGVSYSKEYLTLMQPLLERMRELGDKYGGRSTVQVALNWLLAQSNPNPGVGLGIVPIPGAKSAAQVEEFAGAVGWSLSAEEVEELRELGRRVPLIQGFPAEKF